MLVLGRKTTESISIGDNIKVTICRIGPSSVRLGIEAPREFNVFRTELGPRPKEPHRIVRLPLTTYEGRPAGEIILRADVAETMAQANYANLKHDGHGLKIRIG